MITVKRAIIFCFGTLFFLVPLILWPFTSEVFEFNKIVVTYIVSTIIISLWIARMIYERKIIFRRTILDIPLILFLTSQIISTLLSIDPRTSFLGYYSRFNGGLLSTIAYSFLYWAFVSNVNRIGVQKLIYPIIASSILVSIYGILEHFGIDKNIWVQDVQNRVFSTLGQPNWLAAYLVTLFPVLFISSKKNKEKIIKIILSLLFFSVILFTKSRSGLFGFIVANIIYWGFILITNFKNNFKNFILYNLLFATIFIFTGLPVFNLIKNQTKNINEPKISAPLLEVGGTDSGKIRQIVWKGAVEIWKHNPIFGTGVETFAYSYYSFRPREHNLVSEWDFIYNKAHNEFLNIAANTGSFGLITYVIFLIFAGIQILKSKNSEVKFSIFAGFMSLLVTNFFGFSVTTTSLQLFLLPAFAYAFSAEENELENKNKTVNINGKYKKLSLGQLSWLTLTTSISIYSLFLISKYWHGDILYAKSKSYIGVKTYDAAQKYAQDAIHLSPREPLYHMTLADSYANLALKLYQEHSTLSLSQIMKDAMDEANLAVSLSPSNVILKKLEFGIIARIGAIDENYLNFAPQLLLSTISQAPTDAKLYYNLGLTYAKMGNIEDSIGAIEKAIDLKPNYKEARYAYALILISQKKTDPAKEQLLYILNNIDPKDQATKNQLQELK